MSQFYNNPFNKAFIVLMAALSLFSCTTSKDDATAVNGEEELQLMENNAASFTLTDAQITSLRMQLTPLEKVQKNSFIEASGRIDLPPENRHTISALLEGFIQEITLIAGDKVQKGQALFTIMNPDFLELQRALVEAKNTYELAKKTWERTQTLKEDNIVSTKQFDEVKADYFNAEADYLSQKQHLALVGFNIEDVEQGKFTAEVKILANVSGVISKVGVTTGSFVQKSAMIMEILDMHHFHVEIAVFEAESASIREGQPLWVRRIAELNGEQQQWVKGYVFRVNPSFEESDRSLNVHAHVEEWENPIIGSYVEAKIQTDSVAVWKIPKKAIAKKNNGIELLLAKKMGSDNWKIARVTISAKPVLLEDEPDFVGIVGLSADYEDFQLLLQN